MEIAYFGLKWVSVKTSRWHTPTPQVVLAIKEHKNISYMNVKKLSYFVNKATSGGSIRLKETKNFV